jgi:hypothetical protein
MGVLTLFPCLLTSLHSDAKMRMRRNLQKQKSDELGKNSSLLGDLHSQIDSDPLHEHNVLPLLFSEPSFRFGSIKFQDYAKRKNKMEEEEASVTSLFAIARATNKVSVN